MQPRKLQRFVGVNHCRDRSDGDGELVAALSRALARARQPQLRFHEDSVAIFGTQTQTLGNLFNGNEASGRLDYNWNASNRFFCSSTG